MSRAAQSTCKNQLMGEETLVVILQIDQHISAGLRRQARSERVIECVLAANWKRKSMKWLNYMEIDAELWRQWHGKEFLPEQTWVLELCYTGEAQKVTLSHATWEDDKRRVDRNNCGIMAEPHDFDDGYYPEILPLELDEDWDVSSPFSKVFHPQGWDVL